MLSHDERMTLALALYEKINANIPDVYGEVIRNLSIEVLSIGDKTDATNEKVTDLSSSVEDTINKVELINLTKYVEVAQLDVELGKIKKEISDLPQVSLQDLTKLEGEINQSITAISDDLILESEKNQNFKNNLVTAFSLIVLENKVI